MYSRIWHTSSFPEASCQAITFLQDKYKSILESSKQKTDSLQSFCNGLAKNRKFGGLIDRPQWKKILPYATALPNSLSSNLKTGKMVSNCSIPMKPFGSLRTLFPCFSTKAAPPLLSICRMSSLPENCPKIQFVGNSDKLPQTARITK